MDVHKQTERLRMNKDKIVFEIGDCVYCSYYKIKGIITKIEDRHITIEYNKGKECVTAVFIKSSNSVLPFYLQMVAKKKDIKLITSEVLGLI
jgi:hypothetical protein